MGILSGFKAQVPAPSKVFSTGELLTLIFAQADIKTCTVAARVCRSWYENAANEIWKDLADPTPLFSLLAPMHGISGGNGDDEDMIFTRSVEPKDWSRFLAISARVRTLKFSMEGHTFDPSVLESISLTRPVLHIVPWLRQLVIEPTPFDRVMQSVIFLSPTLTSVFVAVRGHNHYAAATPFIKQLVRAPKLRGLFLHQCLEEDDEIFALVESLSTLVQLEKLTVEVPAKGVKPILDALAVHPAIEAITLAQYSDVGVTFEPFILGPLGKTEGFEGLRYLSLEDMNLDILIGVFSIYRLDHIKTLLLGFEDNETISVNQCCPELFTVIVAACPLVDSLTLIFATEATASTILDYSILEPIFTRLPLEHLYLQHQHPLHLSEAEMATIAKNLGPHIKALTLNPSPASASLTPRVPATGLPPLTLSALIPFAQHCRKITTLRLYVDTMVPSFLPSEPVRFSPTLKELDFGLSPIDQPFPVATFLRGLGWPLPHPGRTICCARNDTTWSIVRGAIALLHQESEDLRRQIAALEKRNKELEQALTAK